LLDTFYFILDRSVLFDNQTQTNDKFQGICKKITQDKSTKSGYYFVAFIY